ncbi:hypothetical protein JCM3766R1_002376 [Sporobolomyces carnicolor]
MYSSLTAQRTHISASASSSPEVPEYEKANGETEHRETRFPDSSSLAAATTHDSEKGFSRYASSTTGLEHVEANKKLERKLVRKLDCVILPMAVLLYLSAYLDRGSIGSSKLMGLEKDVLDGEDTKYSIALSCFFITYILLSIPFSILCGEVPQSYLQ